MSIISDRFLISNLVKLSYKIQVISLVKSKRNDFLIWFYSILDVSSVLRFVLDIYSVLRYILDICSVIGYVFDICFVLGYVLDIYSIIISKTS